MTESRFTSPETGWYKVTLGDPLELLTDADGRQRAASGATDVIRFEVTEHGTRGYQNSGHHLPVEDLTIPVGEWVTIPWDRE